MIIFLLIFILAAAVLAVFVLILSSRPHPSESARDTRSRDEAFGDERQDHETGKAVPAGEELVGELHRLSDKISTSVESRLTELTALLDRADENIVKLNASMNQPPAGATEASEENHQPHRSIPEKYRAVYDLADSGLNVDQIAERTKIGTGEIELILSLRKKR